MKKVRIGILLIILSWLPVAQASIYILHHDNIMTSSESTDIFRFSVWGLQTLIGLLGLWLVGKQAVAAARSSGWKHVPANLWHLFWDKDESKEAINEREHR